MICQFLFITIYSIQTNHKQCVVANVHRDGAKTPKILGDHPRAGMLVASVAESYVFLAIHLR